MVPEGTSWIGVEAVCKRVRDRKPGARGSGVLVDIIGVGLPGWTQW